MNSTTDNKSDIGEVPVGADKGFSVSAIVQAVFIPIVALGTFVYNLIIILFFIKYPRTRTPFTLYVLNLSIADFLLSVFSMTAFVPMALYGSMPAPLCFIYYFLDAYCKVGGIYGTLFIGMDRAWSITFPVSHRNISSHKFTITVCAATWIIWASILWAYDILDNWYYNTGINGCSFNFAAQHVYAAYAEAVGFDIPLFVAALTYVYIYLRLMKRRIKSGSSVIPSAPNTTEGNRSNSVQGETLHHPVRPVMATAVSVISTGGVKENLKYYRLFALMSLSLLVCWIPGTTFFILLIHTNLVGGVWIPHAMAVFYCLEYLSCVFNPFIYHQSLPELRDPARKLQSAVRRLLRKDTGHEI